MKHNYMFIRIVAAVAVTATLSGCPSNYRIEQGKRLAQSLGQTQMLLAGQVVDALGAHRSFVLTGNAQMWSGMEPEDWANVADVDKKSAFVRVVCNHNLDQVALAQETLGAQAQVLTKAAAGPSSPSMGALLKSIRAKAARISGPDRTKPDPVAVCRDAVEADLRSGMKDFGAISAGVGALGKLVDFVTTLVSLIEQQKRSDRLVDLLRQDETTIWAAYYLLACPRDTPKERIPTGRPKTSDADLLGCGPGRSTYASMLDDTRTNLAHVSYDAFQRTVLAGAPLAQQSDLLAQLGRYDMYRNASLLEPTDAGVLVSLRASIAKLIDAVIAGPTSSEDQLQDTLDSLDNLESLLKAWADYRKAYGEYKKN